MSRSGQPPNLKKYMDKQLQIKLNANLLVIGTLRGFDQFMNLVIDNTVEVNVFGASIEAPTNPDRALQGPLRWQRSYKSFLHTQDRTLDL
ncbi:putative small nuclear ribonucleoprotein G [Capsicum annuum]|nr:putative small nuclear ribonucleoprotein G [Capsicum annuum]